MKHKQQLPEDTENKIYVEDWGTESLNDLICKAQEKWGEEVDIGSISIEHEHLQVQCFGYDQYDPEDYKNYFVLRKRLKVTND
jgi:hypothetical protein